MQDLSMLSDSLLRNAVEEVSEEPRPPALSCSDPESVKRTQLTEVKEKSEESAEKFDVCEREVSGEKNNSEEEKGDTKGVNDERTKVVDVSSDGSGDARM